jgi:hypothetical protein
MIMSKRYLEKRTGLNQFAGILFGVFFCPLDGDTFLEDVGELVPGCTVLHLSRRYSL